MDRPVLAILHAPQGAIALRQVHAADVLDLRHGVLRAGLPRDEAIFDGDDDPTTLHFAACLNPLRIVGCASFMLNSHEGQPAWQLRGMATDPQFRNLRIGGALLDAAENVLRQTSPLRLLWCNARTPALRFYQRQGWTPISDIFEIPTAGPHVRMIRHL